VAEIRSSFIERSTSHFFQVNLPCIIDQFDGLIILWPDQFGRQDFYAITDQLRPVLYVLITNITLSTPYHHWPLLCLAAILLLLYTIILTQELNNKARDVDIDYQADFSYQ
jgi:hypothetical protein